MLNEKLVLVTGASRGIGRAIALILGNAGATVIGTATSDEGASNITKIFNENNILGKGMKLNVTDNEQISELLKSITADYGSVDILVNNSGGPHGGPLIEANEDEFRIAFERLLICNHILAKAVFPGMKEMKCGRIINIISTSIRQVIAGLGVSNTIRGSVAQWGKSLALELGELGITVNNVLPGYTSTSRLKELAKNKSKSTGISEEDLYKLWGNNTSLKRLGVPEEIAEGIAFLASDASSYINGHNLSIDGGRFGGA